MYDYGARFYMPDIGRWGTQDLLTETSRRFSPYTYVNNNPIFFTDPTGMLTDGCPGGKCPEGVTDIKTLPNGQSEVQIQEVVLQGKKKETNPYLLGDCFLCTDKGFAQYHGGQTRSEFNFQRQASLNRGPEPGGGGVMMMGGDVLGLSDVAGILFSNWYDELEPEDQRGAILLGGVALIITRNTKIAGAEAKAIMGVEKAEAKGVFTVTRDGVELSKDLKIPSNLVENPFRTSSYGEIQNGKFIEKLRIDPATMPGKKGPNVSHFHINGSGKHIFDKTKWPK